MITMKPIAFPSLQRGVILPIVLVVMMIVTTLVITQVKRGTVDERLAGNWSRVVSGETAAESLLRLCEHVVINVDYKYADWWTPSTDYVNTPVWQVPFAQLDPTKIKVFTNSLPQGATSGYCMIENATSELLAANDQGSDNEQSQSAGSGKNAYLRKHRFTTAVTFNDASAFGGVTYRSQSEIRWTRQ
jgi:Tfp pilus assembly protein PilX